MRRQFELKKPLPGFKVGSTSDNLTMVNFQMFVIFNDPNNTMLGCHHIPVDSDWVEEMNLTSIKFISNEKQIEVIGNVMIKVCPTDINDSKEMIAELHAAGYQITKL